MLYSGVSFPGGWYSRHPWETELVSSSGTNYLLATVKYSGFLSMVVLSCNATHGMNGGYLAFFMWSCGNWGSGNWGKNADSLATTISESNKVLCL